MSCHGVGRAPLTAPRRPENILLKRPPVSRASSSQEGLAELNSDAGMRGKNPPNAIQPAEGIILNRICEFSFSVFSVSRVSIA